MFRESLQANLLEYLLRKENKQLEEFAFSLTKEQGGLAYKDLLTDGLFYIYYFQPGFPSFNSDRFYHKNVFYYYEGDKKQFFHIEREACEQFKVDSFGWTPVYSKFSVLSSKLPIYLRGNYFYTYEDAKAIGQYWQDWGDKQQGLQEKQA